MLEYSHTSDIRAHCPDSRVDSSWHTSRAHTLREHHMIITHKIYYKYATTAALSLQALPKSASEKIL